MQDTRSSNPILRNKNTGTLFAAVLLLLLCLVTYGDILTHGFMIDERIYVKQDDLVSYFKYLKDYFEKPLGHHYSPFYYLLNIKLFQLFPKPFPLYLINLLFFYVDCVLLFVLVYLVSEEFIAALLTSIIFCVHPMTGDILQHITFNILLMQSIFMEVALITLYLYCKKGRPVFYYFISLLMVVLASFCHEIVFLFPLYAAALLFFLTDIAPKKAVKLTAPFVLLSVLFIAIWLLMINPHVHLENLKIQHSGVFWNSTANFARVFFWYLGNLFVPHNIVFMANMPHLKGFIWLWNLLFFGFLAGYGVLIFCYFKKSLESFALAIFLIGFIFAFPASQTRPNMGVVFEPNWLYFSSIGFYLLMVLLFLRLRKYVNRQLLAALLLAILAYYFMGTFKINVTSRTEIGYTENWLRKFPGNSIAMNIVASYYYHNRDLKMPSDLIPDMLNLVDVYIKEDVPQAVDLIEMIASCKISSAQRNELFYKLASYQCRKGDNDRCWESIRRTIGPQRDAYTYLRLSYTLYQTRTDKTAIALLKQCIALYPTYKDPYLLIGVILANEGHYEKAIDFWKQGLIIDPADKRFISNINNAKELNKGNK